MKSASAIAFDYRPSRWLTATIACVGALALTSIALSGMLPWAKSVAAILACAYAAAGIFAQQRALLLRAAWLAAGHWRLVGRDGEHNAELVKASVRGPWIVLRLRRSDGARVHIVLAPDNSDADTRRRLRVRLARPQE